MCADGHTYERAAIQEWIKRKATSPLTNQVSSWGLIHVCDITHSYMRGFALVWYGVATISRLLKIIGLFCRI